MEIENKTENMTYYEKNKEKVKEYVKEYRLNNREKVLENQRKYKLKKFECPNCNTSVRYADKAKHLKTIGFRVVRNTDNRFYSATTE